MWKVLNKEVDLGEPTSFLDQVFLGCTQRQCGISKDIVDNYRIMFESRISAGATEKLTCSENICISSWSCDMEGHAKKCVERTQQLYKISTPCIDDHHFNEEELKSVGELSKACSQIVVECLYLARIGRPDIVWEERRGRRRREGRKQEKEEDRGIRKKRKKKKRKKKKNTPEPPRTRINADL